jgi:hypothetical protein
VPTHCAALIERLDETGHLTLHRIPPTAEAASRAAVERAEVVDAPLAPAHDHAGLMGGERPHG